MMPGIFEVLDRASGRYLGNCCRDFCASLGYQHFSRRKGSAVAVSCQQAVRKSLAGLPLQDLGNGHFQVPVLQPAQDSLPFAMALDLYASSSPSASATTNPIQSEEELLCLQYVLDGSGQLLKADGKGEGIYAGDSILAPHGHTSLQSRGAATEGPLVAWSMVSLTLLLPKELIDLPAGVPTPINKAVCRATEDWGASTAATLTLQQAASIIAGARETAKAKATHEAPPTADGLAGPASSRFGPAMARLDFSHGPQVQDSGADRAASGAGELSALPPTEDATAVPSHGPSRGVQSALDTPASGAEVEIRVSAGAVSTPEPPREAATMLESAFANSADHGSPLESDFKQANTPKPPKEAAAMLESAFANSADPGSSMESNNESAKTPEHSKEATAMLESAFANSASPGNPLESDFEGTKTRLRAAQAPAEGKTELAGAGGSDQGSALQTLLAFLRGLWWRGRPPPGLELERPEVLKRALSELSAFRLPHQTNRLALVFDPLGDQVPFTFGVEIFEPGHKTTPHKHPSAHELFFILAGDGEGFCDQERFAVCAGDVVVFPPGSLHGIDVVPDGKMYCLELMLPNDMFAELVRAGLPAGALLDDDLCVMIASGCSGEIPAVDML